MVAPGARAWRHLHQRADRLRLDRPGRGGGWLVLAPHADDETLGTGGVIASLAAAGVPVRVAFLTDGAGSHLDAPGWSRARIARLRRGEAREASAVLGSAPPFHLDWPDAAPHHRTSPAFSRDVWRLASWCRRHRLRNLAVTWRGEPHCDHEAAAEFAEAVARWAGLRLFHYLVWGWTDVALIERTRSMRVWTVPTARFRPQQRRAIAAHRSQRGGRIAGGTSFRLPHAMLRLIDRPATILLEDRHAP